MDGRAAEGRWVPALTFALLSSFRAGSRRTGRGHRPSGADKPAADAYFFKTVIVVKMEADIVAGLDHLQGGEVWIEAQGTLDVPGRGDFVAGLWITGEAVIFQVSSNLRGGAAERKRCQKRGANGLGRHRDMGGNRHVLARLPVDLIFPAEGGDEDDEADCQVGDESRKEPASQAQDALSRVLGDGMLQSDHGRSKVANC